MWSLPNLWRLSASDCLSEIVNRNPNKIDYPKIRLFWSVLQLLLFWMLAHQTLYILQQKEYFCTAFDWLKLKTKDVTRCYRTVSTFIEMVLLCYFFSTNSTSLYSAMTIKVFFLFNFNADTASMKSYMRKHQKTTQKDCSFSFNFDKKTMFSGRLSCYSIKLKWVCLRRIQENVLRQWQNAHILWNWFRTCPTVFKVLKHGSSVHFYVEIIVVCLVRFVSVVNISHGSGRFVYVIETNQSRPSIFLLFTTKNFCWFSSAVAFEFNYFT